MATRISLDDPRLYINRHLSWIAFNRRVLEEAFDESNPVLERVKFLAITASNLDEFIEVRVAGMPQAPRISYCSESIGLLSHRTEKYSVYCLHGEVWRNRELRHCELAEILHRRITCPRSGR